MNAQLKPLSETRGYLGGGLIAAVLGLSPFLTPLDAYLQIVGEMQEELTPEKAAFFADRAALEPWAAAKFARTTGLQIIRRNERYDDAEFAWAKAEIDFEAGDGGNGETKTVHPNAVRDWGNPDEDEEPPMYVTAQAMWGMGVHPATHCYVNALIGFDDHRVYRIERDDALIADIRQRAARFWKYHIEPRRPPQPVNADDVARLYSRDSGRAVEADADICDALERLHNEKRALALHTARKEVAEFQIKGYMRDATTLLVHGQPALTWRSRQDGVRIFRLK